MWLSNLLIGSALVGLVVGYFGGGAAGLALGLLVVRRRRGKEKTSLP